MTVRFYLTSDKFDGLISDPGECLGQRGIPIAQTLDFTAFKSDARFNAFEQLVFKPRLLVNDTAAGLWLRFGHDFDRRERWRDADNALATGAVGLSYNQVAV